jgi:hypothetical protein
MIEDSNRVDRMEARRVGAAMMGIELAGAD